MLEVIKTRRSYRHFLDKDIADDVLNNILNYAMYSPTAGNQRGYLFYVIKNKEIINKLKSISNYTVALNTANTVILVASKTNVKYKQYIDIDCAIATENIMLLCEDLQIGSVMLAISPDKPRIKKTKKILGLKKDIKPFCLIAVGYTKDKLPIRENIVDKNKIIYMR